MLWQKHFTGRNCSCDSDWCVITFGFWQARDDCSHWSVEAQLGGYSYFKFSFTANVIIEHDFSQIDKKLWFFKNNEDEKMSKYMQWCISRHALSTVFKIISWTFPCSYIPIIVLKSSSCRFCHERSDGDAQRPARMESEPPNVCKASTITDSSPALPSVKHFRSACRKSVYYIPCLP